MTTEAGREMAEVRLEIESGIEIDSGIEIESGADLRAGRDPNEETDEVHRPPGGEEVPAEIAATVAPDPAAKEAALPILPSRNVMAVIRCA